MGFHRSLRNTILTTLCLGSLTLFGGCSATEPAAPEAEKGTQAPKPVEHAQSQIPQITPEESLADFDAAWQLVNDTHFDTSFNGVDWAAMREKYRPQAAEATTRDQSRRVIGAMLDTLGQSHFGIIPKETSEDTPEHAEEVSPSSDDKPGAHADAADVNRSDAVADGDGEGHADVGIKVLIIDGHAVVSEVRPDGPADLAGIRTGWIVSKIRGTQMDRLIERLAEAVGEDLVGIYGVGNIENRMQGRAGSKLALTLLDSSDTPREYTLVREDMPGELITFGNLPPMQTDLEWGWYDPDRYNLGDKKIGYISFTIWMIPIAARFEEAMVGLQDADGIVIDLRGNPGGIGGMAPGLARYFLSEKASLGTMTMRGQEMTFNVSPIVVTRSGQRLKPFDGKVAILTDQGSASTSEFFAGGMQAIERVEVFGTRSAGMALAAAMDKLPSGDVLLHAISDYVTAKGNAIEATGVIPEHPVPVTRADLLNGIDAPAQAAVEWIKYSE
ncbi:MAG: hypothetical protein KC996_01665 [Phycisphaerales bacterium]|nr:hypothetical protein [Phycisphaerales bacterium]